MLWIQRLSGAFIQLRRGFWLGLWLQVGRRLGLGFLERQCAGCHRDSRDDCRHGGDLGSLELREAIANVLNGLRVDAMLQRGLFFANETAAVALLRQQLQQADANVIAFRLGFQGSAQNTHRLGEPSVGDVNTDAIQRIRSSAGRTLRWRWFGRCRCRRVLHRGLRRHGRNFEHRKHGCLSGLDQRVIRGDGGCC